MPRQLKYTPEIADEICRMVQNGVTVEAAARIAGVSKSQLYDWRKKCAADDPRFEGFEDKLEAAFSTQPRGVRR